MLVATVILVLPVLKSLFEGSNGILIVLLGILILSDGLILTVVGTDWAETGPEILVFSKLIIVNNKKEAITLYIYIYIYMKC